MKKPTFSIIYNRRKDASATHASAVEVRVTAERRTIYLSTGVRLKSHEWNGSRVVRRLDADACNASISQFSEAVAASINDLWGNGSFSFDALKERLNKAQDPRPELFGWWLERINAKPLKESTRKQHIVALEFVKSSGIISSWDDLTPAALLLLDEAIKRRVRSSTSVYGYHKRIKPYFRDAETFGFIARCPYVGFATPHGKSERIAYLTDDERHAMEVVELTDSSLIHARDCFLFCCYTGLAYADASSLTRDNFMDNDGALYIISERTKNRSDIAIKVIDKARALLERYDYKMPFVSNQKYNLYLKAVAKHAGITKRVTSHMARHTFATSALHNGIPIEVVSKMLSHADIGTTQLYAKVLADDVMAAFDKLNETK